MSCLYRDYRIVEGYPDYIVSNYGEVFSTLRYHGTDWRELKQQLDTTGYPQIKLYNGKLYNGKSKTTKVHVLVGKAFIGERTGELTYDHIDRNPRNNRADNIRIATVREQMDNKGDYINNKLGQKYIYINKVSGHTYYCIQIRREKKTLFGKRLNVKKYSLEDAIKVRDDFLTSEAKN